MKRLAFLITTLAILALFVLLGMPGTGCTQPQVTGLINGTNQVIDQAISPVADKQGVSGLGPYIRLGATFLRNALYEAVDLVRIFSPNAGEPTTRPSQQLAQKVTHDERSDIAHIVPPI